jgi:acyl-CoA-binding protein
MNEEIENDMDIQFQKCVRTVNNLKIRKLVNYDDFIAIYGFYKQALFGDNKSVKPYWFYFHNMNKWNSWKKNLGKTKIDAKKNYIELVNLLF